MGLLHLPLKPLSYLNNNHLLNASNCAFVSLSKLLLSESAATAQNVDPE